MSSDRRPFFGSSRDIRQLNRPTRPRGSSGGESQLTDEERTWPETAKVVSLVTLGISYADAMALSPLESDRIILVHNARSIPPDERVSGGAHIASKQDVLAALKAGQQ